MTAGQARQLQIGDILKYDDGREGHRNHRAVVLNILHDCVVAQFDDRADTTSMRCDDTDWFHYITRT